MPNSDYTERYFQCFDRMVQFKQDMYCHIGEKITPELLIVIKHEIQKAIMDAMQIAQVPGKPDDHLPFHLETDWDGIHGIGVSQDGKRLLESMSQMNLWTQ